ncbi:MAG: S8 family serine peptidase [Anaerolineales bacterium]|nr:MAG: S8 family serine peptidase [Anaerolineales bacterium]
MKNVHPRAMCSQRVLIMVALALAMIISSACTRARPLARQVEQGQAVPGAVQSTPVIAPSIPTATSTPIPPPEFLSEAARIIGDEPNMVLGQVIVKLNEQPGVQALDARAETDGIIATGLEGVDQLNQQFKVDAFEPLIGPLAQAAGEGVQAFAARQPKLAGLYVAKFDPQLDPNAVASAYAADEDVAYAEPNFYAYASDGPTAPLALTPNDPYFSFQWHMPLIQAAQAWDVSTGQDVLVAVLDTGIAYEDFESYRRAPDLSNTRFTPGYDFVNKDPHANDDEGHGTHIAGTIAQSTNNGQGVSGVAFGATLMPVKVLDGRGQGSYDSIAQGIVYAADRGARVINLSLSGRGSSSALTEAVDYAVQKGVLIVSAAGNSGGWVEYPAAYENVLAVGSVGFNRARVDYSNFGLELDLVAPGGDTDVDLNQDGYPDGILQETFRDDATKFGFYLYEGTSMAAAHVSGVAALLFGRNPGATATQVREAMQNTAFDLGPAGRDNEYGNGLVLAADALAAIGGPPITPTPTSTSTPIPGPSPTPSATSTSGPGPSPTPTTTSTPGPGPSPTPTITPSPSATSAPTTENLIVNGDFETDAGWTFGVTRHPAGYSTAVVHGGARAARLGIVDGVDRYSFSSIWQVVTIPADARRATLNYWVYPLSDDVFPSDLQLVLVLNEQFRVVNYVENSLSDSRQWRQGSYDMTPFAGKKVYVYFGVVNRGYGSLTSAMYVDDVSLTVER